MIEFKAWPKTPRFYRDITITEKIDGTNAGIQIVNVNEATEVSDSDAEFYYMDVDGNEYLVAPQSRKRLINLQNDNAGFARWVSENAFSLIEDLGEGIHFGEWWGRGINRNYGLDHRRFSLFNTTKWAGHEFATPNVESVPVLYEGPFDEMEINNVLADLGCYGSEAAPGFRNPEGICIYHHALNGVFKVTLEDDEHPKSKVKLPWP